MRSWVEIRTSKQTGRRSRDQFWAIWLVETYGVELIWLVALWRLFLKAVKDRWSRKLVELISTLCLVFGLLSSFMSFLPKDEPPQILLGAPVVVPGRLLHPELTGLGVNCKLIHCFYCSWTPHCSFKLVLRCAWTLKMFFKLDVFTEQIFDIRRICSFHFFFWMLKSPNKVKVVSVQDRQLEESFAFWLHWD